MTNIVLDAVLQVRETNNQHGPLLRIYGLIGEKEEKQKQLTCVEVLL